MEIPIYVVTGFLDAGKTTFLDTLLNRSDWREVRLLVIQFESGENSFQSRYQNCKTLVFPKRELDKQPEQVVQQIHDYLQNHEQELDEIWIEWNGVVSFSQFQALFLQKPLRNLCKIQRVIHIADGAAIESLLGRTGSALPDQIASSDFAVVRGVPAAADYQRIRRVLRGINPGIGVYEVQNYSDISQQLFGRREHPVNLFFLTALSFVVLHLIGRPLLELFQIPANTIINVFLGIILQAIPFLLIGVLLSSAIQVFVPQSFIERWFPKSTGLGMLVAILAGFCLPVCDCASIPIFRSLVRKGIPLPVAITFMTATPVINPVVILSTYYAFSGDLRIVLGRVALGIVTAVLIGLYFALFPSKGQVLSGGALDRLMCSCGCYDDAKSVSTFSGKMSLFIRHSQAEFFDVGRYLVVGAFVATLFQVMGAGLFTTAQGGTGLVVSMLVMMAMAFLLSLCSSSDAVVARSFANQFPAGAIMSFLVFGPMMDIKNIMMLSSGFSRRFIGKLFAVAFIVCFTVILIVYGWGVLS